MEQKLGKSAAVDPLSPPDMSMCGFAADKSCLGCSLEGLVNFRGTHSEFNGEAMERDVLGPEGYEF
jgi:hypothetical protein